MRPSIFTLFFIVISTTWASLVPPENDDTVAISKREQSRPPSYASQRSQQRRPTPPPPYHPYDTHLPSYINLPRNTMPPRSRIDIMKKAWQNRDKNRKLAGGILDPVHKLQWDFRNGGPALMRKRKIVWKKDIDALVREVQYLVKLGRFIAWSMDDSASIFVPDAYVVMLDKSYVSGKETKLPKEELKELREAARDRREDINVGTDPNDFVFRLDNGKYVAEYV